MRNARLVGLSPDGRSLIVATDSGEELSIDADARLRAAVRGDRPRLGQLEIEMETSLSPRDIQSRIRGGATLEDVARVAGLPMDRVERFAAPVLAERDHIAITAMSGSVRRRGETSGHRNLRITVTERLVGRGVDIDTIDWDSFRLEDGRWTVTADYHSGEAERHAEFVYDQQGRFSVASNDEARWLLGESSTAQVAAQEADDTEPTVDLSDDLALVRATQEQDRREASARSRDEAAEPTVAVVRPLHRVPDPTPEPDLTISDAPAAEAEAEAPAEVDAPVTPDHEGEDSPLGTLYGMLGGDGYAEDSVNVYAGLSDASAVPETEVGGWEPAVIVNYPIEPSRLEDGDTELATPTSDWPFTERLPGSDQSAPPDGLVSGSDRDDEEREFEEEHAEHDAAPPTPTPPAPPAPVVRAPVTADPPALIEIPDAPAPKPPKRKRASVPSWDEIMFGGPKPPS